MRQIIKAVDIQVFFGKGESMSFKMLKRIKKDLEKQSYQPITIDEFCKYFGISREELVPIIQQNDAKKIEKFQKANPTAPDTCATHATKAKKKPKHVPYQFS